MKVKFLGERGGRIAYYKIGKYNISERAITSLLEKLEHEQVEEWAETQKVEEDGWII